MIKTLTLDSARDAIARHNSHSYCDCELADWPGGRVVIVGRMSHCGGTEKSWLGVVSSADADAIERDGLADGWRRSKANNATAE